jgi:dimethylhistidine N-methyltransferase
MKISENQLKKASEVNKDFLNDVVEGLSKSQKSLPCKYFYDDRGSELFEKICDTPEYYVTRVETQVYADYAEEMAAEIGERALIIEPGAGSVKKISYLLEKLINPVGFVPMDISAAILQESSISLEQRFPDLDIAPVVVDFLDQDELENIFKTLPKEPLVKRRVVFFPGSTIGNFHPNQAKEFLQQFADNLQAGDGFLIGIDLIKDTEILENAYNDDAGITADFNLNLLHRINEELDADFALERFEHKAVYEEDEKRIEMHITSAETQAVKISDRIFQFNKGETIHTENSYKYCLKDFSNLVELAGYELKYTWQDYDKLFAVCYLQVKDHY